MTAAFAMPVQLEMMLPHDIREAIAARPVVYLPLGTIEWHGEHLPVGLDALTAHGVSLAAAQRDGGIVYPTLYYGTGGDHALYPWTVMAASAGDLEAILNVTLTRLQAFGVRLAVLFSGHFAPVQLAMIERIAADWTRVGELRVIALAINSPKLPLPSDHAGVF
jgi:creatinine amidohydrolase